MPGLAIEEAKDQVKFPNLAQIHQTEKLIDSFWGIIRNIIP